ncbi:TetR/AcrR family transcriptional regulator [Actinomadura rudentiformis]|uniref:TetR/AcrR family transcriptional regulator n=1 Tax=Actinomadura rudentiformis TaxID=359158 RepID=A0A6H9YQF9_9ACTN|nr:TetR/AcrR family transcriptional regulator [Actinomadura rudentiformis]KAB2350144.1 TetR/AcrR family transcriptional regulator [Actinomadura rudentiformis]
MTKRDAQREATRQRLVDAAVESLIEEGYAASTTLAVQRRAGVSRGALLHHFPTREELFGAAIGQLVERNEQAVRRELAQAPADPDPVARGLQVLRSAFASPSFGAELELWAAARTSKELRAVLRRAEGAARRDLYRVIGEVLGPEVTGSPAYPMVADLTVQLLRGMAISDVLYREAADQEPLLEQWATVTRMILAARP